MSQFLIKSATPTEQKTTLLTEIFPPMLKSLIPAIKLQLRFCNTLSTIPYEWDEENGRLQIVQSKFHLVLCKVQICFHVAYTILMTGYFLSPANMRTTASSTRMLGLTFLVCFIATMLMRLTMWDKKKEVVNLFNNFLSFETTYLPATQRQFKGDKVSRVLMSLGLATAVGLPGLMSTMLLVRPCMVPHLGYILFRPDPDSCDPPAWHIRFGILIFDTWMWVNCISSAIFFGFQIFFPGLKCLGFYIQLIFTLFAKNHRSPTRTSQTLFCFHVYQHLRVLGKLFNFCLQSVFIPTQITAGCMVIIIGLYTCIKLHPVIPMPGFAFFPLISCDGFAIIFMTQEASKVLTSSSKLVNAARKSRHYGKRTYFRKLVNSTNMIKIRFGSTNYIDKMTPLMYLNFCFTQTVSLVLLS